MTVEELAAHTHQINHTSAVSNPEIHEWPMVDHSAESKWQTIDIKPEGGDKPHNNVQPSKAVYCWLRVN